MGRAVAPDGRVITLEVSPEHATVARDNLARAELSNVVDVRVVPALEALPEIERAGASFDLVFIDADKENTADYFEWAVRLTHPGALIIVDNVVRHGTILDAESEDASVQGMRRFNEALAQERRVSATVIQTVGVKGYDGFALALVLEAPRG
jgi:caffeoyl-CoA O-methyltransferase